MFIHHWFEQTVDRIPHEVAVMMNDRSLTYLELDQLSNKMAHKLQTEGVRAGDVVGISLRRSPELIAGVLAILKTGAAYLPLDPEYPVERLKYMVEHSRVKCLLLNKDFQQLYQESSAQSIVLEELDLASLSPNRVGSELQNISLCYVIYTSGSTGKPKGVALGHKALVNLIEWQNAQTRSAHEMITLQFTPLSFDVHFQEIFSTLTSGGKLLLIDEATRLNPSRLLQLIEEKKVGRIFLPFVALNQLAETAQITKTKVNSLKEVTTAGEQLKITPAIREFFLNLKDAHLYNHYGPSESHVVTSLTLKGNPKDWPGLPSIGRPINNARVYLLDSSLSVVSHGESGEIYLGGVCLAEGYLHDSNLTTERFIQHEIFGRLYKTGDLATLDQEGDIKFLGRKDGQVKIRGYRIETGEIELAIQNIDGVKHAAVTILETDSEKQIVAYVSGDVDRKSLRQKLKAILPDYMMPTYIEYLAKMPLTPSGKVAYKELPNPSRSRPDLVNDFLPPETETQKLIAKVWKNILKLDEVGVLDSFFELGGNSLLAIRCILELNQIFNKDVSVIKFFENPSITALTDIYEEKQSPLIFRKNLNKTHKDIAVIGMAGKFPGARNIEELWENLLKGVNGIEKFPREEADPGLPKDIIEDENFLPAHGVYPEQELFDYKFFGMTPREAELMDPQQRKFLELAVEALESAGYYSDKVSSSIGVFAGMANSKYSRLVDMYPEKINQVGDFNVMLGLEKDYIATRTAYKLNLKGPALSIHTGCSTSLVAIIEAVKSLRAGDCEIALAGGISISGTPNAGHQFQEGGILSHDGTCRPFDESATGTVFTEGGGIVVLKSLEDAERDGDNILGIIKGVGINNDGSDKMSFTAPSVNGQMTAILSAHADAGISARSIQYIEAHGTATPVGDPIEVEALRQAFSHSTGDKSFCYLSSIKSNIGHLTSAAGVAGFIKALLVVRTGKVPGTLHFKTANKLLDLEKTPFIVTSEVTELEKNTEPRRAGVSSFGVGGTNGHLILEEYKVPQKSEEALLTPTLFKISAKSSEQVLQLEKQLVQELSLRTQAEWKSIAYTLEVGRKEYPFRRYLVLKDKEDLSQLSPSKSGSSQYKKSQPLYMIFPGQGSQYAGMGKRLYETSGIFRTHLDQCSEILEKITGYNIRNILFQEGDPEKLNNTYYTQPAMFVIEYSLGRTYLDMGYRPAGFIGHSIGEYAAATLSGIFSLQDGIRIIAKRAQLMEKVPQGSMLSVALDKKSLQKLLGDYTVDIAAINGPASIVVAGHTQEIKRFQHMLIEQGIGCVLLKTSHAFHSRMMETVVGEFEEFLKHIPKNSPSIPIISTVLTERNDEVLQTSSYWAKHIVNAVSFAPTVAKLKAQGVFLEIGPKNTLINLTRKQAIQDGIKDLCFISSIGDKTFHEDMAFMKSLGDLWCTGHNYSSVTWIYRKEDQKRTTAPTYPFEKNRVWLENKLQQSKKIIQPSNQIGTIVMNSRKVFFSRKLIEIFESSSGIQVGDFSHDTTFLEMGMDSLFLTQISLQLKKELKIQVSFRQLLEEYSTINQLTEAFVDKVELNEPLPLPVMPEPVQQGVEQIEVQQRSHTPVMDSPILSVGNNGLESIIQRQLDLMNQQVQLLRQAPVLSAKPIEVTPSTVSKVTIKSSGRGADIKTAKDSFGAAAKINIEKTAKLSEEQNRTVQQFFQHYCEKTKSSKKFTQDHRKNHADPRVVTGFKPENKEIVYPIVVKRSKAQHLWDLDDNKYVDMICGFGSNFFGNGNERIKKYVLNQIDEGIEIGPQHPLVGEVSRLICELTGNERTAFCNTGSEAVLGAMRLARTVTGRDKIIVFSGSYHGINDEVIIRTAKDKPYPAAPGINGTAVSNMIVLEYGTEESLNIIRSMAGEVAAILVEPVQSRRCNFHPKEFLQEIRKITEQCQTCLIFDEVITGFRIHPGGAQAHFDIRADLCTYGKIVGGGMPIGVISGKAEYMDALDGGHWQFGDDSTPTVGVTYFAGTFVRHPLALAAAKGALEIIKDGGTKQLSDLNQRAQRFADDFNDICKAANIPFEMHNFGSLMKPKWTEDVLGGELLFALMRYNGVHVYDGFPWFVNLAHTQEDLQFVLQALKKSISSLQGMGFLPGSRPLPQQNENVFDANNAPVEGAKLGRDEKGNPAWFVENPTVQGEYYQLEG